jgi:hypothetical protein
MGSTRELLILWTAIITLTIVITIVFQTALPSPF